MDIKVSKRRITINNISKDVEVFPREQINEDHVNNLLQDLKEGSELPLVDLFFDGKTYILADGHHRLEAFIKAGFKTIEAVIHKGDKRDAFIYSCGVNAKHGLPLTNADKRKVVDRILRDDEWREFSDRIIAKHCAVSPRFVGKRRLELTVNGVQSLSKRKGADGRTIETNKIGKSSGDTEDQQPADPKKGSIPVVVKGYKDSLPPKSKGKGTRLFLDQDRST